MLLAVQHLSKSYGAISVLQDISFIINAGNRIGLVGANGVGKSTLLKLLTRQEEPDTGSFTYASSVEVGYLPQATPTFYGYTLDDLIRESVGSLRQLEERMRQLETLMATANTEQLSALLAEYDYVSTHFQDRGGYDLDYRIDMILEGLRLSYIPRTQDVATLSGGEKARLGLATLLLQSPDILLMDEPTNHLDITSLEWLEQYLATYRGAALLVSHDRQFLNKVVNQIFEIDEHSHTLTTYEGIYDAYIQAKAAERLKWEEEYERQQEEIKELRKRIKDGARQVGHSYRAPRDNDKFARHFFAQRVDSTIARNIHAAEEQLKRIETNPVPKPPEIIRVNSSITTTQIQSREVIQLKDISKSRGERILFSQVNLQVAPDSRIILFGPNGAGKTTLLKIIMGLETPDSGEVRIAPGVRMGYLPQEAQDLDLNRTVLDTYRYDQIGYESDFIAKLIGYGLFRLEDMQKTVGQLSLGQRRKLEIARLMATGPNVLLLDEPTNYISLDVLEAFEAAVLAFPGPVIAISHDRWFIQRFHGQIWELRKRRLVQRDDALMSSV